MNISTTLIGKDADEVIKSFLKKEGYVEKGNGFYVKKHKDFRIVVEKENVPLTWQFSIIGKFKINHNVALENEIGRLKEKFIGFWNSEDAKKEKIERKRLKGNFKGEVENIFKKDKDKLQYLAALLLNSGADFIYDSDYFIAFYGETKSKQLKLKVIKIDESTDLILNKNGHIHFADGEILL